MKADDNFLLRRVLCHDDLQGKGVAKDLAKARALYAQVPESELSKQMIEKIDNGQV